MYLLHSSRLHLADLILSNVSNELKPAMTQKLSNELCKDLIKTCNLLQIYFCHPSNKIVQMWVCCGNQKCEQLQISTQFNV